MKKLKVVGILAAVVLIGGVVSIPLINNHTAYKVEKTLCEIPLPEETELIESLSQAGKLLRTKIIDTTGVDDDWTREQRGITWETPILLGISRFY